MTTKEMISVMQAYEDGKEIEFRVRSFMGTWYTPINPVWNWANYEYRVKPEPKYVPYDSVAEVEKDKWLKGKSNVRLYRIIGLDPSDNTVRLQHEWCGLRTLFEQFTYEDGSPCGKLVSE